MNTTKTKSKDAPGFSIKDVEVIEEIIASVRKHLAHEGMIYPKDPMFPFAYHNLQVLGCLGDAGKLSTTEIGQSLYRWGAENGPRAYAFQAIEGACRKIYGDKYHREMPEALVRQIDDALRGTTVNFVDFVKRYARKSAPEPQAQLSMAL
jgi:hypothetical protein